MAGKMFLGKAIMKVRAKRMKKVKRKKKIAKNGVFSQFSVPDHEIEVSDCKDDGFSQVFAPDHEIEVSQGMKVVVDNKDDDFSQVTPPEQKNAITSIIIFKSRPSMLLPITDWDPVRMCPSVVKLSVQLDDDSVHKNTITETGFIYASTDESSIVWGLANFLIDKNGKLRPGKVVVTLDGGNGEEYPGTVLHVDFEYKLVVIKIYCKKAPVANLKPISKISPNTSKVICLDWFFNEELQPSLYDLRYPAAKICEHRLHIDRNFADFSAVILDADYSIIGVKRDACLIHTEYASVLAMDKFVELLTPVTSRHQDG